MKNIKFLAIALLTMLACESVNAQHMMRRHHRRVVIVRHHHRVIVRRHHM